MTLQRMIVVLSLCVGLAACNTMEGFGQDVQKGGSAIENAAEGNK
jgi:entericidin B